MLGLTQAMLADLITELRSQRVSQQSINDIEHGLLKKKPSVLNELAQALQTTTDYLLGNSQKHDGFIELYISRKPPEGSKPDACFILNSHEMIERPPFLRAADAWTVKIASECMAPLYDPGDTLFVDPSRRIHNGDRCVFTSDAKPTTGTAVAVGRLVRRNRKNWVVTRLSEPDKETKVSRASFPYALFIAGSQNANAVQRHVMATNQPNQTNHPNT
jgi:SOS-response transcriptional repressor LexA